MLFAELAATSAAVAATRSRLAKRALLVELLRRTPEADVAIVSRYLGGELRQRRTGLGWRSLSSLPTPSAEPSLSVQDVDLAFERMASLAGAGSSTARGALVGELFSAATAQEQVMLRGLVTGELRQGSLDALLLDAVAEAAGVPADAVRRAAMLAGATEPVAVAALASDDPLAALGAFGLVVGRPVRPMLAQSAPDVAGAFEMLEPPVVVDTKLDGIRIQVHKRGDEVGVFTRSLDDITARVPGDRRGRALPPGAVGGARRGGARGRRGRAAASVPGDRVPVGFRADRRGADAVLLRLPARRRHRPARRTLARTARRPGCRGRSVGRAAAGDVVRRRGVGPLLLGGHRRPGGRRREVVDRALRGRSTRRRVGQGQAPAHARPRRARGRVGLRPASWATCPTSTSALATPPAGSSCSARRSRA